MRYLILVAGGTGNRMKSEIPKQFLQIKNKPLLIHALEKFHEVDPSINFILVLEKNSFKLWDETIKNNPLNFPVILVEGGETRYHSTLAGINLISDDNSVVAIHDAVRPLLSKELIIKCYEMAEEKGSAIPCISIKDSIRIIEGKNTKTVKRSDYLIVQTPQCFNSSQLKTAFEKGYDEDFTDEASVFENAGYKVHITEGESWNMKITVPEDLLIAEALMNSNSYL